MSFLEKHRKACGIIVVLIVLAAVALSAGFFLNKNPEKQLAAQLELGNRYLEEMDYEQAVVAFTKAIEIDPMNTEAYLGLSDAYAGLGDMEQAISVLETGYELTQDERLRERLEELQADGNTGSAEAGGESETDELPYIEFPFAPEDILTIAGYNVLDGFHMEEVVQAASAIMPNALDQEGVLDYTGWQYGLRSGVFNMELWQEGEASRSNITHAYAGYYPNNEYGMVLFISRVPSGDEIPLIESKVKPGISYEEALDTLGITQAVEAVLDGKGSSFESSHGNVQVWIEDMDADSDIADGAEIVYGRHIWLDVFSQEYHCFISLIFQDDILEQISIEDQTE